MKNTRRLSAIFAMVAVGCGGAKGADPETAESVEDNSVDPKWDPGSEDEEVAGGLSIDDQVALGATLFGSKCSGCHGKNGEGGERAPKVIGDDALPESAPEGAKTRTGSFGTAQDLFDFISKEMPPGKGKLGEDEAWGVVAFLLSNNDAKPDAPLSPDNASEVSVRGGSDGEE